jgi:hypothetical protein
MVDTLASMNSIAKIAVLAFSACAATLAYSRDCAKAPVRDSQQALCYATAYAEKNGLPHARPLTPYVSKGKSLWTVRFADRRVNNRGAGWEVDVDPATGMVKRFLSYKERER